EKHRRHRRSRHQSPPIRELPPAPEAQLLAPPATVYPPICRYSHVCRSEPLSGDRLPLSGTLNENPVPHALSPETTRRCVSPEARKSSTISGVWPRSSPSTKPP